MLTRQKNVYACIDPWPFLQSTPFLYCSCPPGRVGHILIVHNSLIGMVNYLYGREGILTERKKNVCIAPWWDSD